MARLILVDTTEVIRVWPRKLHAALAELDGKTVNMSENVGVELAPLVGSRGISRGESEAERLTKELDPDKQARRLKQVRQQAWWAQVWRDEKAPYQLIPLTEEQLETAERVQLAIPHECFYLSRGLYAGDHRDAQIVCDALALNASVIMTSNIRTIDHARLNAWVETSGKELGVQPHAVVYEADGVLQEQAQTPRGQDRLLKAALIAQWPTDDKTSTDAIIDRTQGRIHHLTEAGAALTGTGQLIVKELENRAHARRLVAEIRDLLPLQTISTRRRRESAVRRGFGSPRLHHPYLSQSQQFNAGVEEG